MIYFSGVKAWGGKKLEDGVWWVDMGRLQRKAGKLITNNAVMEVHEYKTINVLLMMGEDVELLKKSRTPRSKSADIFMRKLVWEMKSPNGKTIRCVEHALRRATHQAPNVIMDLRRMRISDDVLTALLEKLFRELRSVRNLWIITKTEEVIKYKK